MWGVNNYKLATTRAFMFEPFWFRTCTVELMSHVIGTPIKSMITFWTFDWKFHSYLLEHQTGTFLATENRAKSDHTSPFSKSAHLATGTILSFVSAQMSPILPVKSVGEKSGVVRI